MTSVSNMTITLTEFARLLDVYGAERTRWPAEARAAAGQLVARDAEARKLLAEAEALDQVLVRAPVPSPAVEAALAERIMAAARRSPRIVNLASAAPAAAPGARVETASMPGAGGHGRRRRLFSREAGAVGLLAASLVFGVVIGSSSLPSQMVPAIADMAGLAPDDGELVMIALSDEVMQ